MRTRRVGASGLVVGRIGLGTLTWGQETDADEAGAILAAFRTAGGTLVCTSDGFGDGAAEDVLGRLIAADRSELVVAAQTGSPWAATIGGSRRALLAALDASLDRLRTDHVDVWLVRGLDGSAPIAETLSAMEHAVRSGRARYTGFTDVAAWQLATAATMQALTPGATPVAAVHTEWSLLARDAERELVPAATASGVGVLAWSPLGRGVLTGKYRGGVPRDSRGGSERWQAFVTPYLDERATRVLDGVLTAADGLGVSPAAVALAWLRDRPGAAAAVVGPRTSAQLQAALAAEELVLPDEIEQVLDEVSAPSHRA
jgi:aryl-alcohol dehydrogenase-like predicted oxidoreductase